MIFKSFLISRINSKMIIGEDIRIIFPNLYAFFKLFNGISN